MITHDNWDGSRVSLFGQHLIKIAVGLGIAIKGDSDGLTLHDLCLGIAHIFIHPLGVLRQPLPLDSNSLVAHAFLQLKTFEEHLAGHLLHGCFLRSF